MSPPNASLNLAQQDWRPDPGRRTGQTHFCHHLHQHGRRRNARTCTGLIGRDAKDVVICTFHAIGVRLLREDGAVLGLKSQFSILDSDDVTSNQGRVTPQ